MKIEIKHRHSGAILFVIEANTWRVAVEAAIKAGVTLSGANLSGADLSWADLSKRFIQVGQIGSRRGVTTYCFDDDKIWCGCWSGTLKEFEMRVKKTHKSGRYREEYLGAIKYIRSLKRR